MVDPVRLLVPRDERFRDVGPELAARYYMAAGGTDTEAPSVQQAVADAVRDAAAAPQASDQMTLDLSASGQAVEVTLRCGDHTSVVTRALPADRTS